MHQNIQALVLLDRFFDVVELAFAEKDIARHLAGIGLRRRHGQLGRFGWSA